MTDTEMARTFAEAEAQSFVLPAYGRWFEFAHLIDGYAICKEMGSEGQAWYHERWEMPNTSPEQLTLLDVRLLLFFTARAMRFSGNEPYTEVNLLLELIAQKSGQPYIPLTDNEIKRRVAQETAYYLNQHSLGKETDKGG